MVSNNNMVQVLTPKIAIIGAGCAGLAAAATLANKGINVTVFEAASHAGGRAREVNYKGINLDNGQHILLGAYTETLKLLRLAGVNSMAYIQRLPLTMQMRHLQDGLALRMKTFKYLPAPLHLLAGILLARGLTSNDKYLAIRMMLWLYIRRFKVTHDYDLKHFLEQRHQSDRLIKKLWEPLCLAALNTPLELASSRIFVNVLRDSFARKKRDSDMLLSKVDLSKLIAEPLSQFIQERGSQIRTHTIVKNIAPTDSGYTIHTENSEEQFNHVIIAVGPHQLDKITSSLPEVTNLTEHFNYEPITTVYLQYDSNIRLPYPMQGLLGSTSQWVFDRGRICGQDGLLAVVISASGIHQTMTQPAIANLVIEELTTFFPKLKTPIWYKVISEKRATFSCQPHINRPSNKTDLHNLYLAGDYTEGDYPATIEGAMRSGISCAKHIIEHLKTS